MKSDKVELKRSFCLALIAAILMAGCTGLEKSYSAEQRATGKAEFMLSFDDGPLPDTTERVLNSLARLRANDGKPVKAVFFLLADAPDGFWQRRLYYAPYELWTDKGSIRKYPKIAELIRQAGHVIGNHSTHHPWFRWPWLDTPEAVQAEFFEWETIAAQVLGPLNTRLFRPPYFVLNQNVRETANRLGYRIVMGESVGDAIPGMTLEAIKQKTVAILTAWDKPKPCLLIFHDNRPTTYQHLEEIVGNLQQQGFRLVHFDFGRL